MTFIGPELADWMASLAAQGACLTLGLCLAAGLLILLGPGCATDDGGSSLPWGGMKGLELNSVGAPSPLDTRGR